MGTPYLQLRRDEVPSTQDLARSELSGLPVVVVSQRQTAGRGRTGSDWVTAPRALAASAAIHVADGDRRPLSLMAGVAAIRAIGEISLKWPNDLVVGDLKVGGILVERSAGVVVVGLGVNLWWPAPPDGAGALEESDPGVEMHGEIGGLWAAELFQLIDEDGWPIDEYRAACSTLGLEVSWEPDGRATAVDVNQVGELVVEQGGEMSAISSGAIRHLRSAGP